MIPTISSFEKLKSYYSEPQYTFLWVYGNRLLVRENKTDGDWLFFIRNEKENLCRMLIQTKNFESGLQEAEKIWNPKNDFKSQVLPLDLNESLKQIESILLGSVKRNKISEITQADFCFIYWNEGDWHCFYPKRELLVEYHLITAYESKQEPNKDYINFLNSEKCLELRKSANESGMIEMVGQISK